MKKQYILLVSSKKDDMAFNITMQELNIEVPVHIHDCTELVIILGGSAVHIIDGEEYDLNSGDVFVINIDSEHGYSNVHNLKLGNIMFDFSKLFEHDTELRQLPGFQSLFILEPYFRKDHKFESKFVLGPVRMNFAKELLELLKKEYDHRENGYKPLIRAYFLALVAYLSRYFTVGESKASDKLFHIANAFAYLEKNFLSSLKVSYLASIACLSTRQFTRIFKSNYKTSPKEYIIKLRLEYACSLIRTGNMKLSMIAMESGFSDISFFSRQFKAKFGVSPLEYRRNPHRD